MLQEHLMVYLLIDLGFDTIRIYPIVEIAIEDAIITGIF